MQTYYATIVKSVSTYDGPCDMKRGPAFVPKRWPSVTSTGESGVIALRTGQIKL